MVNIFNVSQKSSLAHLESQIGKEHDSNTQAVMKDSNVQFNDLHILDKDLILSKGNANIANIDNSGLKLEYGASSWKWLIWDNTNTHMEVNDALNVEGVLKINNTTIVDGSQNATFVDVKCDNLTVFFLFTLMFSGFDSIYTIH